MTESCYVMFDYLRGEFRYERVFVIEGVLMKFVVVIGNKRGYCNVDML